MNTVKTRFTVTRAVRAGAVVYAVLSLKLWSLCLQFPVFFLLLFHLWLALTLIFQLLLLLTTVVLMIKLILLHRRRQPAGPERRHKKS